MLIICEQYCNRGGEHSKGKVKDYFRVRGWGHSDVPETNRQDIFAGKIIDSL